MPDAGADVARNRALWTIVNSEFTDEHAFRAWAAEEITWGLFQIPERDLGVLGDVRGLDVLELGCGTAYLSGLLARQGARPVGLDLTPAQLDTAGRCQERFGLVFPLVEGNAENVPLPDAGFDLVVSEYGASVWCDPGRWVAEAARLLRRGGRLVYLTNSVLATLCVPELEGFAQERLLRPQRELNRVQWPGGVGSSFTQATASGSASCAPTASSSKPSTSSTPRRTGRPTSTTTSPPPNGPGSGRWRTSGLRASPADPERHPKWVMAATRSGGRIPSMIQAHTTTA